MSGTFFKDLSNSTERTIGVMLCIHIYENWKKNQERHCCKQFCGSKYIEFESGSRILAQFGSGSRSEPRSRVMLSIKKFKNQCCGAKIIYFRLRLLFGSTVHNFGSRFGSSSCSSPSPLLTLKKWEIFWFNNNIQLYLQK